MAAITNCPMSLLCTRTWNALARTKTAGERYCTRCKKTVHLCRTQEELDRAAAKGWCVAASFVDAESPPSMIVGLPEAPYRAGKSRGKRR